ncbi:holin [Gordonia phage Yvonnetastic]|uniref:Holin n=1 Tax=Gordonia phage Yvonnetastic TaxID=1821566 RepID=A0A142K910_9CAUD|nr:holin [Gordonia phage Yvonnetastic]AMS02593.1 hypothetical protein SEA_YVONNETASTIC_49 [Gordonia phage Yvonnetastic]WKW86025.1 membrane protein [Gordonia Phage JonJames]
MAKHSVPGSHAGALDGALEWLRNVATPEARAKLYRLQMAITLLLVGLGVLTTSSAAVWVGLVSGVITFLFAAVQKSPAWRTLLYAVLAPAQAFAQYYGYHNDQLWLNVGAAVATVLGLELAAEKAKTYPVDPPAAA